MSNDEIEKEVREVEKRSESRLHKRASDMFSLLQSVYSRLTHNEPLDEAFRNDVRKTLISIDHVPRN